MVKLVPVLRQKVIVEHIDHDAGEATPRAANPVAAVNDYRMGIGKTVDPAMQIDRPEDIGAVLRADSLRNQRALDEITQQTPEQCVVTWRRQEQMRKVVHVTPCRRSAFIVGACPCNPASFASVFARPA